MRSWMTRVLVGTAALASVGGAVAAVALASPPQHTRHHVKHGNRATDPAASETSSESAGEEATSEVGGTDSTQQAAACQRAGVDPNGSNVQYDEHAGACSTSGGGGDQTQP
jgi:hypothetical protein